MGNYKDEISQFIYEICYPEIWKKVSDYLSIHPSVLDLTYCRVKYPDSCVIIDMVPEFARNIRIDEDHLLFDVVVSGTFDLEENNEYRPNSAELMQWLSIPCDAVVTDSLKKLSTGDITPYIPGTKSLHTEQSASGNIVPVLFKRDLEKEATAFLEKYCPEALEKPMAVPIEEIAEAMQLHIIQGYRISADFSIFGEIFFADGQEEVSDLFKVSKTSLEVSRGTILIDAYTFWERNLGCVKNTIAHEVYHWYKHRMYAAIKHILHGKEYVACRCPADLVYPKKEENWTDEQRMEWQANNMAPRILMPYQTFKTKVEELYRKYDYPDTILKEEALNHVAQDLANFYGVSRQSALIRMIETGYKEAASIYNYDQDTPIHRYIDLHDAFYEYRTNAKFRQLLNSGRFIYADGYFVINDEQFVSREDDGRYILTDYSWAHLDECTLQFSWQTITPEAATAHFPYELFHRKNENRKVSKFESDTNASVIDLSEELKEKRAEFEAQQLVKEATKPSKTCWKYITQILDAKKISKSHFCSATLLGEEVYRKAYSDIKTKPSLRTIVAIGRGLDLSIDTVEEMLRLAGHAFDDSLESQLLEFCITGLPGESVEEANDFLESYGVDPLGSKQLR